MRIEKRLRSPLSPSEGAREKRRGFASAALFVLALFFTSARLHGAAAELKDLSINGGLQDGKARLVIEAQMKGSPDERDRVLFSTALEHAIQISRDAIDHTFSAVIEILDGDPRELTFVLSGDGEIQKVTGDRLQDWSIRQETNGTRLLVLRPRKGDKPLTSLAVQITARRELKTWANPIRPLALASSQPSLFHGYVRIRHAADLEVQPTNTTGVVPIETRFLPATLRGTNSADPEPLAFRFQGAAYTIPLTVLSADPEARRVVLHDFKLEGQLTDLSAAFTLTATRAAAFFTSACSLSG